MLILVLAANTAYADFPRLASIVARDRFLPRQFTNQGDRLAFSNGILILSVLAAALLVVFAGDTHALIPLYMIGVFVSFTLSQAGMVIHWRRSRDAGLAHERVGQRLRRPGHGHRPGHRRDHQGGRRRVAHHPDDSGAGGALHDHAAPLRSRRLGADPARLAAGACRAVTSCWCRSAASSGPWSRRCSTPGACRPMCGRCMSRWIRRGPTRCASSGRSGVRAWSWWSSRHRTGRCSSRSWTTSSELRRDDPSTLRHRHPARVRPAPAVAAPAAQPARAAHQGRAAVQAERRGHERAVPSGTPSASAGGGGGAVESASGMTLGPALRAGGAGRAGSEDWRKAGLKTRGLTLRRV